MIDDATGELTLTEEATPEYGGQKYQCTCGTESSCHIIHCKLHYDDLHCAIIIIYYNMSNHYIMYNTY